MDCFWKSASGARSLLWEAGGLGLGTGNVMVVQQSEWLWGPKMLPIVGAAFIPNLHSVAGMEKVKEGCFSPPVPPSRSTHFSQDGSKCRERPHWGKRPEPCEDGKDEELPWQLALQPLPWGMPPARILALCSVISWGTVLVRAQGPMLGPQIPTPMSQDLPVV